MDASGLSQIHTLTLYKLTALVTVRLFSGPTEGHHLRKVLLHYHVECTFLAELNLDYTAFLVFICSFLFVCVSCSRTQTPSVSPSAIILRTLPSGTYLPVMKICHNYINTPATLNVILHRKSSRSTKKIATEAR